MEVKKSRKSLELTCMEHSEIIGTRYLIWKPRLAVDMHNQWPYCGGYMPHENYFKSEGASCLRTESHLYQLVCLMNLY